MEFVENMLWLGAGNKGRTGEPSEEAIAANPERHDGSCRGEEESLHSRYSRRLSLKNLQEGWIWLGDKEEERMSPGFFASVT